MQEPWAEGLELYLDVKDVSGSGWHEELTARLGGCITPPGFDYLVEGPLRSLDGSFFDVTNNSESNREVIRRLVSIGLSIKAKAAVIHVIAPTTNPVHFKHGSPEERRARALPLLTYYVELCLQHGLVPTIENIPPIARMRENRFVYSGLGVKPDDLLFFADKLEGLKVTLDVSHAQLYCNALRTDVGEVEQDLVPVLHYYQGVSQVGTLEEYVTALGERIYEVHISNATGLLGEGMPYDQGEINLDLVVDRLLPQAHFLVTEVIEPDPNHAVYMRQAQQKMTCIRQLCGGGGEGRGI